MRLLVIDDSATVRAMVEQVVGHDPDCEVVGVASDVPAARALLGRLRPDLITLDLNMPGVNGLEFLDELAGQRHAPVIVLSSSTVDGATVTSDAIARGAEACFDKARVIKEAPRFRQLLRRAVERHRRRVLSQAAKRR